MPSQLQEEGAALFTPPLELNEISLSFDDYIVSYFRPLEEYNDVKSRKIAITSTESNACVSRLFSSSCHEGKQKFHLSGRVYNEQTARKYGSKWPLVEKITRFEVSLFPFSGQHCE